MTAVAAIAARVIGEHDKSRVVFDGGVAIDPTARVAVQQSRVLVVVTDGSSICTCGLFL